MATSIKLNAALQGSIRHLAELRRRTPHWIMCEAIAQYVGREEKRESFKQEAMRAWQNYQAAGQHVTHEEMDAYLAQLEAGEDLAAMPDVRALLEAVRHAEGQQRHLRVNDGHRVIDQFKFAVDVDESISRAPLGTSNVDDLHVDVVRKDIKHVHLSAYPPDGRVRISTPLLARDNCRCDHRKGRRLKIAFKGIVCDDGHTREQESVHEILPVVAGRVAVSRPRSNAPSGSPCVDSGERFGC